MKEAEWKRRTPLDLEGVQLLGAALLLNARMHREREEKIEQKRKEAEQSPEEFNKSQWPYDLEHHTNSRRQRERTEWEIRWRLEALDTPEDIYDSAKDLKAKDFRFRWDHLIAQKFLMAYISDEQPDWCVRWDRETPISKHWDEEVSGLLTPIFEAEFERLTGQDPDFLPEMRDRTEFEFHLAAWKLCEPEPGRGQPSGRRWPDGLSNAASYARMIRRDAQESGVPITNEAAIEQALEKFKIIGSREFNDFPEKSEAIVSDAGHGEAGRREGAKKAIRKLLLKWDQEEKNQDS